MKSQTLQKGDPESQGLDVSIGDLSFGMDATWKEVQTGEGELKFERNEEDRLEVMQLFLVDYATENSTLELEQKETYDAVNMDYDEQVFSPGVENGPEAIGFLGMPAHYYAIVANDHSNSAEVVSFIHGNDKYIISYNSKPENDLGFLPDVFAPKASFK